MVRRAAFQWFRRPLVGLLFPVLSLLATGCPAGSTDGDGNDPPPGQDLQVDVTIDGQGTVDQEADGSTVTLTAVAAEGWEFDGWAGADVEDVNPLTVDANDVSAIIASFLESDEPPPPDPGDRDADADGVRDADDECPGTTAGASVDDDGCADSQRDTDGDDVTDDLDECDDTPSNVQVDERGCPVSIPGTPDDDDDGVANDIDQCDDTPADAVVDANGCADSQRDSDDDNVADDVDQCDDTPSGAVVDDSGCAASQLDADRDGVTDDLDDCDDTPPRTAVGANGCPPNTPPPPPPPPPPPVTCGNGAIDAGEQCDDGNTTAGDGCSATCQNETPPVGVANDRCTAPATVADGTTSFSTRGALTDGPNEPAACTFFGRSQIGQDIWYCYTATCTGTVTASLCGSQYDTKMAIYAGCGCPTTAPLGCSDDDCGTGAGNVHSRVGFAAVAGQSYMLRIGGFLSEEGDGRLTIRCGAETACGTGGDCFVASTSGARGCSDATCCDATCELDTFCCDVEWDDFCAGEASGVCTGSFPACQTRAADCAIAHDDPGCNNVDCCNAVCGTDPFCCLNSWDGACVDSGDLFCTNCGRGRGDCFTAHAGAGCGDVACCARVCVDDPFCCDTDWDADCAERADLSCR